LLHATRSGALDRQVGSLGKSTQIAGHQMAQMSAQLQDLFIQIQAGGSPVTALIQQGSQLSGVFGGTGNALRAVASLISPAVLGFGAAAAALAAVGYSFSNAEKERTAFTRGLALTGNAVGQTAGALDDAARAVGGLVGGQSAASQALALYVASGQQAGASLQVMTEAALRLQRVGGPAVEGHGKGIL
jgi:phage-related minor tail protein